ncbi:snRNA-activating protein complex subunit 1-like [Glandiceps talaboti]
MSSTVSIGIRHDCQSLLHRFVETESVRYEQFACIWREMNFSLLQCGLRDKVDQKVFLEETFQVVVAFFLPPYGFQVRVGALYLLYGFYNTQTHIPKIKIRITLQQWQNVLAFHEEVRQQQHLDTEYVFRKLRADKAFLFVAMPTKIIPNRGDKTADDDEKDSWLDQPSILSEIYEGEPLERLDNLHTEYQQMKCLISGSDVPNRSLAMVKEPLAQEVSSIINEYEEWRKKRREASYASRLKNISKDTEESDSDAEWKPESASTSRRQRIDEIKKRSYSGVVKVSRSRRHRQVSRSLKKKTGKRNAKSKGRKSFDSAESTECEDVLKRGLESLAEEAHDSHSELTADSHFERIEAGVAGEVKDSMPLLIDAEEEDKKTQNKRTSRKSPSKILNIKEKSLPKRSKKKKQIVGSPSQEDENDDQESTSVNKESQTKQTRGKRKSGKQTKDVSNRKRRKTQNVTDHTETVKDTEISEK